MTDLSALTAAALATDDDTPRLAYLDALEEAGGHEDYLAACREFYAKCMEKRKYGTRHHNYPAPYNVSLPIRCALPGWREWLASPGDEWIKAGNYRFDPEVWPRDELTVMNWNRLVPALFRKMNWDDLWRRKGSTVEVELRGPHPHNPVRGVVIVRRARLTFARGWLARVEFRSWQDADALLPAILADQPFTEAGITRLIGRYGPGGTVNRPYVTLLASDVGPALSLVQADEANVDGMWKQFEPGPRNDAEARARRALSDALRKRAGAIQADKPSPHSSDHQTPPNRDKPDREQP